MKSVLCGPLVCGAALATYLVVHVFAGGLHHHGTANRPARVPITDATELQLQTNSPEEDQEEESCLLCSVLHLAQIPPTALQIEAITVLTGEAFSATAILRRHPLETATYSRGPPLM
jgi:hypothetical protein